MRIRPAALPALLLAALSGSAAAESVSGIDKDGLSTSVRPQDDFNAYVNGAWIRAVGHTRWDVRCAGALDPRRWYVVSSNHQSWVDIFVLQEVLGDRIPLLKFMLKRELLLVPFIGLAWWALEHGTGGAGGGPAVLQVHVGFGDPDLQLDRADPFLLQPFLAATQHTGGRVVLLHCHPYLREAGMLAHLYPHVHLDAGLALAHVGANADTLVRESLDLAPFSKVLFATDAWGVPERVLLGATVWRDATTRVLGSYVADHGWPVDEAIRIAELIAWRNAEALYGRPLLAR